MKKESQIGCVIYSNFSLFPSQRWVQQANVLHHVGTERFSNYQQGRDNVCGTYLWHYLPIQVWVPLFSPRPKTHVYSQVQSSQVPLAPAQPGFRPSSPYGRIFTFCHVSRHSFSFHWSLERSFKSSKGQRMLPWHFSYLHRNGLWIMNINALLLYFYCTSLNDFPKFSIPQCIAQVVPFKMPHFCQVM